MPRKDTGLSPFEMMMGHPYLAILGEPQIEFRDKFVRKYLQSLSQSLLSFHRQGLLAQRPPLIGQQHEYQPGDLVLIKAWRTEKLTPGWEGPYQVLLVTESAVRTREHGWTHYHRVKPAPPVQWKSQANPDEPLKLTLTKGGAKVPG